MQERFGIYCFNLGLVHHGHVDIVVFTKQDEQETFDIEFNIIMTQICNFSDCNVKQTMNIVQSVSTAATSYASHTHLKWPYMTIPNIDVQMQEIHALSMEHLIFLTLVMIMLNAWGMYSFQNQEWIQDGLHVMIHGHLQQAILDDWITMK